MNTVHTLTVLKWITELEDKAPTADLEDIRQQLSGIRTALEFHLELPEGSKAPATRKPRTRKRRR